MLNDSQRTSIRRSPRVRSHYALLVDHFVRRIISIETSDGNEPDVGTLGVMALLAVPGAIYSFFLFEKYSTFLRAIRGGPLRIDVYAASLPDKYLLLSCSMAVTAVLVALKWDRILPGMIDHSVLASLPVRLRTIFFANVTALSLFAAAFIIDLNAASSVLFPLIVLSDLPVNLGDYGRFVLAHICCVLLASGFSFLLCLSILCSVMALVPRSLFHQVSAFARFAIIGASSALSWTAFNVPHPLSGAVWIPSAWYTALYQLLQDRTTPAFEQLAVRGLSALVIVLLTAAVGVMLSYKRHFMRITEFSSPVLLRSFLIYSPLRSVLNRTLLRKNFDRSLYWLGWRLLFRSEPHMIRLGTFTALGVVVCAGESFSGSSFMVGSFPLIFLVVVGFRSAIDVPAGTHALTTFRNCSSYANAKPLLRKLLATILCYFIIPVVMAVSLTMGVLTGVLHAVFLGSAAMAIFDCMLFQYAAIPFTSLSRSFQDRSLVILAGSFLAFLAFTTVGPVIEREMFRYPVTFIFAPGIAILAAFLTRPPDDNEALPDNGRAVQTLEIES